MDRLRLKIIWGAADRIRGFWHLGLWGQYEHVTGYPRSGLAISVRGMLLWGVALTVSAYLLGLTAMFFLVFQRAPHNEVTYTDTLLLPLRWSKVQEARGRMLIAAGLDDIKQQRWSEAAMKLRAGLARYAQDPEARLALAKFHVMANQRSQALQVLTEDLASGYPGRAYLESLFALANDGEDFDLVAEVCGRFPHELSDRKWLGVQRKLALLRAHRAEEVLRLVDEEGPAESELDREARVTALLELKRTPEALAELERWQTVATPGGRLVLARLKARALRDAGRLAEMNAALEQYRTQVPTEPRALAFVVAQQWLAGETVDAAATLEEFFLRFGGLESNYLVIVAAMAEAGAKPLVRRCAVEAAAHGFASRTLKLALAHAQLATGEWAAAEDSLAGLRDSDGTPAEQFQLEWLRRLLGVVRSPVESPASPLIDLLQRRRMPLSAYRQTLDVLMAARRLKSASQVIELALRSFPENASLTEWRKRLESPAEGAPRTVAAVEPERAARGEQEQMQQLESAAAAGRWAAVADAARAIRVAKPDWFAAREPEVLEWQIRAAAALDDVPELLASTRRLLDGGELRAARLVEMAKELEAKGQRANGERLLKEVLRRNPDFPPAVKLTKEWAAAAEAADASRR